MSKIFDIVISSTGCRLHAVGAAQMLADWVERDPDGSVALVKDGVETDCGFWVAALVGAGYEVFAINRTVIHYCERHSTSGASLTPPMRTVVRRRLWAPWDSNPQPAD